MEVVKQSHVKEKSDETTVAKEFVEETPALGQPLNKLSTRVNTGTRECVK